MAELYLVEFKGARREYFFNTYYHSLVPSDFVVIQAERGEDIGRLSKRIEIEIDFSERDKPRSILRKASPEDVDKVRNLRQTELDQKREIVTTIKRHGLAMKVVDVECQYDGNKMTVYFTADHRVDFRELVKDLAARYKTRIELRQIGVRDEAKRIGGFGICGLQQCCSSFLTEFQPVSTQHARDQDLALNPSKISGNCGRLLCCLRYESDNYIAVKKQFPRPGTRVRTEHGSGVIERIDVFNEEAVIRDEENIIFRAPSKTIVEVMRDSGSRGQHRGPSQSIVEGESVSEDDLKKLDDSENSR